jgi:trans-aconitate methyltransferase
VTYTFGDSAIASERLRIVAQVMEPVARAALAPVDAASVRDVIDLGCGPGHTSRLLAALFPRAAVTGVDQSAAYVDEATGGGGERCRFVLGDVGDEPLPGAPADLVYARYLLSHLAGARGYVERWCRALRPGGWLVLEEPEVITSTDPDFGAYERVSATLVQTAGAPFYAGPLLAELPTPTGMERVHDEAVVIDITAGQAASMFWRNARAWDRAAVAAAGHEWAAVQQLADRLEARENDPTAGLFNWRQRQLVLRKNPG